LPLSIYSPYSLLLSLSLSVLRTVFTPGEDRRKRAAIACARSARAVGAVFGRSQGAERSGGALRGIAAFLRQSLRPAEGFALGWP